MAESKVLAHTYSCTSMYKMAHEYNIIFLTFNANKIANKSGSMSNPIHGHIARYILIEPELLPYV